MSESTAPVDCQRMIVIREDLSGFVRAGDHVIEFQLAARAAADIAADLMRLVPTRRAESLTLPSSVSSLAPRR